MMSVSLTSECTQFWGDSGKASYASCSIKSNCVRTTSNCAIKSIYDIGEVLLGILNYIMSDFSFIITLAMNFYLLCIIIEKDVLNAC